MELHFNINLSPKFGMTMCIVKYAGIELVIFRETCTEDTMTRKVIVGYAKTALRNLRECFTGKNLIYLKTDSSYRN